MAAPEEYGRLMIVLFFLKLEAAIACIRTANVAGVQFNE